MISLKLKAPKIEGVCAEDAPTGFHKIVTSHNGSVFKLGDLVYISESVHSLIRVAVHLRLGKHYKTSALDSQVRLKPVTSEELEVVNAD